MQTEKKKNAPLLALHFHHAERFMQSTFMDILKSFFSILNSYSI